ncbi:MAG TPA: hypothetical protein VKF81_00910 [Blastocatellia bacterium]|nr:hypothetical protein [Blastocatellia bacterium]
MQYVYFFSGWFKSNGRDGYVNAEVASHPQITTYDQIKELEKFAAQQFKYDHVIITFYTLLRSEPN